MPIPSRKRPKPRAGSREDILRSACRLFATHGLENVTFGQIAKAARISRPLVYFHFKDQRTLFLACVHRATVELHRRFTKQIDGNASGLDQLEAMGRAYFQLHVDEPALFQLLALYEAQPPADGDARELYECIEQLHVAIDELKTGLVRRGIRDGSIRRDIGDPQRVGTCLWAFSHGLAQLLAVKGTHLSECLGLDLPKTVETGFKLLRATLSGKRG
jgi:AcrR family transcriptional regulator